MFFYSFPVVSVLPFNCHTWIHYPLCIQGGIIFIYSSLNVVLLHWISRSTHISDSTWTRHPLTESVLGEPNQLKQAKQRMIIRHYVKVYRLYKVVGEFKSNTACNNCYDIWDNDIIYDYLNVEVRTSVPFSHCNSASLTLIQRYQPLDSAMCSLHKRQEKTSTSRRHRQMGIIVVTHVERVLTRNWSVGLTANC